MATSTRSNPLSWYVPIERRGLPATDRNRWLILAIDAIGPVEALAQVRPIVQAMRLTGVATWAAVRDIPSFEHMQALRDARDAAYGPSSRRELGVGGYA